MPMKDILIVSLDTDTAQDFDVVLQADWKLLRAFSLSSASLLLKERSFSVGLIAFASIESAPAVGLNEFLELHQSIQWIGILPLDALEREDYRCLIISHLFDFLTWPLDRQQLLYSLRSAQGFTELGTVNGALLAPSHRPVVTPAMDMVGNSPAIVELRKQVAKVAQVDAPVLIWGESGSGKELVAHAIHNLSPRASHPFVAMNCGAVPASLIQSELFGYERGAFTGAVKEKRGLIESAEGGTLFLDEVADLALELQVNLLRFLQERTIVRVGSSHPIEVNVRVIAASHMRLEAAVSEGRFREDLLYRLNVLPLNVPPLRERKEDLDLLAQHFFHLFRRDKSPRLSGIGQRAMQALRQHDWPGNVRELINRIRRAMVMAEGRLITPDDLGLHNLQVNGSGAALEDARLKAECVAIQECLAGAGNNKTVAARELGVSRMTLYRLLEKHGIDH